MQTRLVKAVAVAAVATAGATLVLALLYYYHYYPAFNSAATATPPVQQLLSSGNSTQEAPVASEGSGLYGYDHTVLSIAGAQLSVDIADTDVKRVKGLDVRNSMTEGEAMLFTFDTESEYPFWMNGMKFPIDIIWLDSGKTVVHIEHSLPPCPNQFDCPNHYPNHNARYVLETVAGFAERHDIKEGTRAEFQLKG